MSAHTPGPWTVERPMDFELSIVEAGKQTYEWKFIASIPLRDFDMPEMDFHRAQAQANARLIAAAPDLLAACRALLGAVNVDTPIQQCHALALEAIAKAEGKR